MGVAEDEVDRVAAAAAPPPALDHPRVVAMEDEVCGRGDEGSSSSEKEEEADGFGSANVLCRFWVGVSPVRPKKPRTPSSADDDGDADGGAGIRVAFNVEDRERRGEWDGRCVRR